MRLARTLIIMAAACAGSVAFAQPKVSAVLNGASYSAVIAPGTWVAIYGTNFAAAPLSAQSVPLPAMLGSVSVNVGTLAAPLLYVSANQINALIPSDVVIPQNTVVPLVVTSPSGTSIYLNLRL